MSNIEAQETRARVEILISEIRQIYDQYKIEVPKKRRPWPKSIQERVLELWRLGMSSHQIAVETGLPAQTMYSWRQRVKKAEPTFLEVMRGSKRHRRSNFDLQLSQLEVSSTSSTLTTVTVITSDGVRIEGVLISDAAELVRQIGQT